MNRSTYLQDKDSTISGGGMGSNLMYLLIGGGIGATLALLFAPKAGSELRQDISSAAQRGYDETLEIAGKVKDQSSQLYGSIKDRADQIYGYAAEKLNLEGAATPRQVIDNVVDAGKQLAGEALEGGSNLGNHEQGGPGASKPSNIH